MKNKKGFVLLETLVVTIFTLFIFTILYNSVVPLLGKYDEMSYYNDVDTTYDLFHLKKLIVSDPNYNTLKEENFTIITCDNGSISNQEPCYKLFDFLGIDSTIDEVVYIKSSYIETMKTNTIVSSDIRDYLNYIDTTKNILVLQNNGYLSYINLD